MLDLPSQDGDSSSAEGTQATVKSQREQSEEGWCHFTFQGCQQGLWNVVEPRWERRLQGPILSESACSSNLVLWFLPEFLFSCRLLHSLQNMASSFNSLLNSYLGDNLGCLWSLFGAISKISILFPISLHLTPVVSLLWSKRSFFISRRVCAFMPLEFGSVSFLLIYLSLDNF